MAFHGTGVASHHVSYKNSTLELPGIKASQFHVATAEVPELAYQPCYKVLAVLQQHLKTHHVVTQGQSFCAKNFPRS